MQQKLIAGRYGITGRISEDDTGVSCNAVDEQSNQKIVIKVLHEKIRQQSLDNFLRFKRDPAILSKNTHPNIIPIYDAGEDVAAHVAQEYAEGRSTLASQTGRLRDLEAVTDIVLQIQWNKATYKIRCGEAL
jgi:hypothetical protein